MPGTGVSIVRNIQFLIQTSQGYLIPSTEQKILLELKGPDLG